MKLFEALGGWVATVPELDVKMRLGTHCYKHAWHAELWHKRLPELREMNPDRLTLPANDAMVRFVEAMTEPEAPELTIEKLVGVYRVLIPHFIAAYTYHLNDTSQITDAPTIRSLQLHPPGRVRRLARRRDADPVADRDARGGRAGRGPPGPAGEAHGRGRRHRRPGSIGSSAGEADQVAEVTEAMMRKFLPRRGAGPRRAVPRRITDARPHGRPRATACRPHRAP